MVPIVVCFFAGGTDGFSHDPWDGNFNFEGAIQGALIGGFSAGMGAVGLEIGKGLEFGTAGQWMMSGGLANAMGHVVSPDAELTWDTFFSAFGQGAAVALGMYTIREIWMGKPDGGTLSEAAKEELRNKGMSEKNIKALDKAAKNESEIWDKDGTGVLADEIQDSVITDAAKAQGKEWYKYQHADKNFMYSYKPGDGTVHLEWNPGRDIFLHIDHYGTATSGSIFMHNVVEWGIVGNGNYYGMVPSMNESFKK